MNVKNGVTAELQKGLDAKKALPFNTRLSDKSLQKVQLSQPALYDYRTNNCYR